MKRKVGYMTRVGGSQMPGCVVVLGVQSAGEPINRHPDPNRPAGPLTNEIDMLFAESWRYDHRGTCRHKEVATNSVATFWDWLGNVSHDKSCTWIFALNAYTVATALGVWDMLQDGRLVLAGKDRECVAPADGKKRKPWEGYLVASDPPTVILLRWANTSKTIKIVDVRNYGVQDYHDLTSRVSKALPDQDWTWDRTKSRGYAAREFLAVREFVTAWLAMIRSWDLGNVQNTAASQAYYSFRKLCLRPLHVFTHGNEQLLERERAALYGGRCECRRLGVINAKVYHCDIKSAYHYAALNHDMPYRPVRTWTGDAGAASLATLRAAWCSAHVTIRTQTPMYPVRVPCERCREWQQAVGFGLATRPCTRCRVVYPVGEFTTWLCGEELRGAVACGHVLKVHTIDEYAADRWLAAWAQLIDKLRTECRADHDATLEGAVKTLGVSLYGKFAQRGLQWEHVRGRTPDQPWGTWYQHDPAGGRPELWRSLAGRVERQTSRNESPASVPIVTAAINAAARMRLWTMLSAVQRGRVYYYDTDSVWCDAAGLAELEDADLVQRDKIGFLSVRGVHDRLEIRAIRHYKKDDVVVRAGPQRPDVPDDDTTGQLRPCEPIMAACVDGRPPQKPIMSDWQRYAGAYWHGQVTVTGDVVPLDASSLVGT